MSDSKTRTSADGSSDQKTGRTGKRFRWGCIFFVVALLGGLTYLLCFHEDGTTRRIREARQVTTKEEASEAITDLRANLTDSFELSIFGEREKAASQLDELKGRVETAADGDWRYDYLGGIDDFEAGFRLYETVMVLIVFACVFLMSKLL